MPATSADSMTMPSTKSALIGLPSSKTNSHLVPLAFTSGVRRRHAQNEWRDIPRWRQLTKGICCR